MCLDVTTMGTNRPAGERDPLSQARTLRGPRKGPQAPRVLAATEARRKALELTQRQRLVQAMIELSAKSGYQEVSIAELCAGAGVSTVTFYEEFQDKEEALLSAYRVCAEGVFGPMRSALLEANTSEIPRLALGAMLEAVAWPATEQPRVYVCGPTPLVEAVAANLVELGHQPALVKTERFGPTGGSV